MTDHKPLVAIIRKDAAMLSQHLQYIMLPIHQYRLHIMYRLGSYLYIVDWLSWNNHTETRDQEITGININVHAISTSMNIPYVHQ